MTEYDALTVKIADTLLLHQLTRRMAVAMGSTCACGYWTGQERPGCRISDSRDA